MAPIPNNPAALTVRCYNSNPKLKAAGVAYPYTQEEIQEYMKCKADPIYFIENYIKVVHPDRGLVLLKLHDYQKEMILSYANNRKTISITARQAGKSTVAAAFFCWFVNFHNNKTCAMLANKAAVAREILSRVCLAFENIPFFLQQGVVIWNKGSIELENGSKVMATGTSSSAIRGFAINLLYIDEMAFIPRNIAEEFFVSVYPTISAGKESKLIITSTPNGFNLFWKIWSEAEKNMNGFNPILVTWDRIPGRDQKWKEDQISTVGPEKFSQENECEFLGSSNTLIPSKYLKAMSPATPLHVSNGLTVIAEPVFGNTYVVVADPSRGSGNDNSAFVVFDVTQYPIRIAAVFKDKHISPMVLPTVIHRLAETYNNAYVLVEINDLGQQVADILWQDLEYENCLSFPGAIHVGVRTTKSVKRLGTTMLKNMIESEKFIIDEINIIEELSNFIKSKDSYEADAGYHDDLVMCCVLLSWLTRQQEFQMITDNDIKQEILKDRMRELEEDVLPFGFIVNGNEEPADAFLM